MIQVEWSITVVYHKVSYVNVKSSNPAQLKETLLLLKKLVGQ